MIWIIRAMLVYAEPKSPVYSDYMTQSFDTRTECLNYVYWNKVALVEQLLDKHKLYENKELTTFAFFCENRYLDEV